MSARGADRARLVRLVHVGCRELGLDDTTRRELQVIATGKASLREMDAEELDRVVDALKTRGFRPYGDPRRGGRGRPAAARPDIRYAPVLWRLLAQAGAVREPGPGGLNAFVRARFGAAWGHVPIDVDALRDERQIADLVEALKAMCRREGIETRRGDG